MQQSPSWEAKKFSAGQEIPAFLKPEVSLPRLQAPATCPSPEPDEITPLPEDPS